MTDNNIIFSAFTIIAITAYLLGSLNFAIIATWIYEKKDIRSQGSGNAGLTNVMRSAGKMPVIITLTGDLAKGIAAVFIGYLIISNLSFFGCNTNIDPLYGKYIAGFFAVFGHVFPIYYKFKGGKGVLTIMAVGLGCNYPVALSCFAVFLILSYLTKYVSVGSVAALTAFPIFTGLFEDNNMGADYQFLCSQDFFKMIVTGLIAIVIISKHIPNIKRLVKGEENKFTFKKK